MCGKELHSWQYKGEKHIASMVFGHQLRPPMICQKSKARMLLAFERFCMGIRQFQFVKTWVREKPAKGDIVIILTSHLGTLKLNLLHSGALVR